MRASTSSSTLRILKVLVLYNVAILLVWELTSRRESCQVPKHNGNGGGLAPKPPRSLSGGDSSAAADIESLLRKVEQEVEDLKRTVRLKKQLLEELEHTTTASLATLNPDDKDAVQSDKLFQEHSANNDKQQQSTMIPPENRVCDNIAARGNNQSEAALACRKYAAMESMVLGAWELVMWSQFDLATFHERNYGVGRPAAGPLSGSRRAEVDVVVDTALRSLPRRFERRHLVEGFRRTYRRHGTQYELFFKEPIGDDGDRNGYGVVWRVRVVRPLGKLVRSTALKRQPLRVVDTAARRLHLVVAVPPSRGLHRLRDFLDNLVANVTSRKPSPEPEFRFAGDGLHLTLVAMDADTRVSEEAARRLGESGFHDYRIIQAPPSTATDRFAAVRLSMNVKDTERHGNQDHDPEEVVVSLDLDHLPSLFTLCRCRAVVEAGRQAYWPVAFHLYNPLLMTYMADPYLRRVSGRRGFWAEDDFASFCIARSDLLDALGKFPVARGHGPLQTEPGLALYRQLLAGKNMSVIRAPDRGLLCPHRPSKCELKPVQEPVAARKAEMAYDKCREKKARSEGPPHIISELIFGSQEARDELFAKDAVMMKILD